MVSQGVSSNGKQASSTITVSASGTSGSITEVSQRAQTVLSRQRPWSQVMDRTSFDKPESFADVWSRALKNIAYFQTNYLIFVLAVIGLSLLWHPVSLVVLAILMAAWIFLYFRRTEPLVLFNRIWSENQVLVVLGIATVAALFLTKTGSTVITAIVISIVAVLVHASFRRPDDLFHEEQKNGASDYTTIPQSTFV